MWLQMSATHISAHIRWPMLLIANHRDLVFAIIVYTARVLDDSGGRNSLELQPWVEVNAMAPPTLIIHAMNDSVDNIRNPMAYALALNDAGVPVEMRVYAKGGHAFGMRPTEDPITTEWPGQVKQWLRSIAVLSQ
jgi:acetyl esterase/lipase